jgi:hypothetical protein
MHVYCVYPAMSKSPKQLANYLEIAETSVVVIRLFRIMSIPITFCLFRVMTAEMLGRLLLVFTLLL